MAARTVASEVVETLRDLGVRHVFGVPSGGWVDYMDAIRRTDGIEFVLATHEGGAAFMADVCGRIATNLSTGVGSALLDRSPMIALTDEMPAGLRGRTVQMGIDHQALFRPLTKHTTRLANGRARATLLEAARIALAPRPGPVHVGLPVGLGAEPSRTVEMPAVQPPAPVPEPPAHALARAKALLDGAERPLLALGLGAAHARVGPQAEALASRLGLPVVLTPMAKGLIGEDHDCYAGVLFHALSDVVSETHHRSDLVICVGYDPVEFNFESWLPDVPLINVDVVPADIHMGHSRAVCDVTGDIAVGLSRLFQGVLQRRGWDLDALAERRDDMFERLRPTSNAFGPCAALEVLRRALPADGIMTCDVGAHTHLIGQKWPTPEPGLQIMSNGWSAMGFGVPAAIAAKLCRPDRTVCCVAGDGGFLMSAGELATVARLRLPVVFVVFTDNDLALIRIKQQRKGYPIYGTPVRCQGTLGGDDIFGVPVLRAHDAGGFEQALNRAMCANSPVIVEAKIESLEYDDLVLKKDNPDRA
jgi:acetolactate synthase-1/2/3 large subunit